LQDEYVEEFVYPFAQRLNDTIVKYNDCAGTTFYMTWGRENGDASNCGDWPPVCTYEGMDDLLRERYLTMTNDNEAIASPVGAVWRFLREYYPGIELYSTDGSHPSLAGSYAGAITFYTTFFKKDPTLVSFNSTLSPSVAIIIREAVRSVVYDNLSTWFIGLHDPNSSFKITHNGNLEYAFTNTSEYSNDFLWLFGDGGFSTEENPTHTYDADGIYEVSLNVNYACSNSSISTQTISTELNLDDFIVNNNIKVFPNPTSSIININASKQIGNDFQIEIYSILGKKLKINEIVSEEFNKRINIESLTNGIYFLKIINNENQYGIVKFIKE
ncbi:MAG: T9SS type A sorting domain-containing protein, partial [Flavobacteriaceae bacterium]|nr:T9SS type A sorting domain-containing protein [Flavobacteriaceae bacterium]